VGDFPGVARTRADITPEWLSRVLGVAESCPVTSASVEPAGSGQMGALVRADLEFIGVPADNIPRRVIVKQAAESAEVRNTCDAMGLYAAEVRFYQEIAPRIGPAVPRCYFAAMESDSWFTLVMEDLADRATPVDTRTGRVDKAATVLTELAQIQSELWEERELHTRPWLAPARSEPFFAVAAASTGQFLERFGDLLDARHVALFERLLPRASEWAHKWSGPLTLSHGDFRWDNMFLGDSESGPDVIVVDWQAVKLGPPLLDVAFFMGACLTEQERLDHERALLKHYHSALQTFGVADYGSAQCWQDYRRNSVYGLLIAGLAVRAIQTARGDAIIAKGARRAADFVLSLDAEELFV